MLHLLQAVSEPAAMLCMFCQDIFALHSVLHCSKSWYGSGGRGGGGGGAMPVL